MEWLLPAPAARSPRQGARAERAPELAASVHQPSARAKGMRSGSWEGGRGICDVLRAQAASRSLSQAEEMALPSSTGENPPITGVSPSPEHHWQQKSPGQPLLGRRRGGAAELQPWPVAQGPALEAWVN